MKNYLVVLPLVLFLSCSDETSLHAPIKIDLVNEEEAIQDAIVSTQQLLIGKLMSHIDTLDFEPAVTFCAENAQRLTDSISLELGYRIRRVSPKNRNERNAVSKADLNAYKHFENTKNKV
jgi:hypothetical protein